MNPTAAAATTLCVGLTALALFPPRAAVTQVFGGGRNVLAQTVTYEHAGHAPFWRPAEAAHWMDSHTLVAVHPHLLAAEAGGVWALACFAFALARHRQVGPPAPSAGRPPPASRATGVSL